VLLAALPCAAPAATLSFDPTIPEWHYDAASGEVNDVTFTATDVGVDIADTGTTIHLGANSHCTLADAHHAHCAHTYATRLVADLGDGDDQVRAGYARADLATFLWGMTIELGAGNDTLTTAYSGIAVYGGDGDDRLDAGAAAANPASGNSWGIDLYGEAGDDVLVGSARRDALDGGDGNDQISGGDGDDGIAGGPGNDHLDGAAGNDGLSGGPGNDVITGGDGNDQIGAADETGNDVIDGGDGDDLVDAGPGNDVIDGGNGDDDLVGGDGADVVRGGPGDDWVGGGLGPDVLQGGDGIDATGGARITLDGLANDAGGPGDGGDDVASDFEILMGTPGDDVLIGNGGDQTFYVTEGDDRISGGGGTDTLRYPPYGWSNSWWDRPLLASLDGVANDGIGGRYEPVPHGDYRDLDVIIGGSGDDVLIGDDADNTLVGGEGRDTIVGGGGSDVLDGGDQDDAIDARDGQADVVHCGDGDDGALLDRTDTADGCEGQEPPPPPGPPPGTPATPAAPTLPAAPEPPAPSGSPALPAAPVTGAPAALSIGTVRAAWSRHALAVQLACVRGTCRGTLQVSGAGLPPHRVAYRIAARHRATIRISLTVRTAAKLRAAHRPTLLLRTQDGKTARRALIR
jgi:Ca2+-binding RTX toxin-like protein